MDVLLFLATILGRMLDPIQLVAALLIGIFSKKYSTTLLASFIVSLVFTALIAAISANDPFANSSDTPVWWFVTFICLCITSTIVHAIKRAVSPSPSDTQKPDHDANVPVNDDEAQL